jgi:hypothetical protein
MAVPQEPPAGIGLGLWTSLHEPGGYEIVELNDCERPHRRKLGIIRSHVAQDHEPDVRASSD